MSAVDPNGNQKYWLDGKPIETLVAYNKPVSNIQKYWLNGKPLEYIIPQKRSKTSCGT